MIIAQLPVASFFGFLTLALALPYPGCAAGEPQKSPTERLNETTNPERNTVKIRLAIDGKTVTASLNDSPAAQDFLSLLPLTLTLEDYASTEKIAYLPKKLITKDAPAGFTPSAGDITYYAPRGNLAIFHKDFRYSEGLINLGRIDSGAEALKAHGTLRAMIER